MNIIQSSLFKKPATKLTLKVGSHVVHITVDKTTRCQELVRMALKECKINNASRMYSLFERASGVERLLSPEQNVYKLIGEWQVANKTGQIKYELIVKLFRRSHIVAKSITRNCQLHAHRIYQIGREKYQQLVRYQKQTIDVNSYEQIDYSKLNGTGPEAIGNVFSSYDAGRNKLNMTKVIGVSGKQNTPVRVGPRICGRFSDDYDDIDDDLLVVKQQHSINQPSIFVNYFILAE
jgi:hypothetical protein